MPTVKKEVAKEGRGIGTENNYGFPNSQTRSLSVSNLTIRSLYRRVNFRSKKMEKKNITCLIIFGD